MVDRGLSENVRVPTFGELIEIVSNNEGGKLTPEDSARVRAYFRKRGANDLLNGTQRSGYFRSA